MNAPASTGDAPLEIRARSRQKTTPVHSVTEVSSTVAEMPPAIMLPMP